MKPTAKQLKKFEALLDNARCSDCDGYGGWRSKTEGVECPVCGGTGLKEGLEIALIDTKAELPYNPFAVQSIIEEVANFHKVVKRL